MSLDVRVKGGNSEFAEVQDKSILASVLPYPPLDVEGKVLPFFGAMSVNGDGVTTELTVDGSVTPIDAFIGPPVTGDLYVTTANILIADSGSVQLNRFGSASALTNGVDIFFSTANTRFDIRTGLKTNFDFIRLGSLTVGIGGKTDAFQIANADPSNNDGFNPVLDFTNVSPLGIRLRKDTQDKIGVIINDDLTGVSTFNIFVTGFIRF